MHVLCIIKITGSKHGHDTAPGVSKKMLVESQNLNQSSKNCFSGFTAGCNAFVFTVAQGEAAGEAVAPAPAASVSILSQTEF